MVSSQHADKRRRILRAAFEVFGELGYRKTTIQAIADRVGFTPGSLYNYFQDKDDLFLASLSGVWDLFASAIDEAVDNQQIAFARRALDLFAQAEGLLRRAHSLLVGSFSSQTRRERHKQDLDRICAKLVPFFEEGRQGGLTLVPADAEQAFFHLRLLLAGSLWTLSLVEGPALDAEIGRLRSQYQRELEHLKP
ncbi:MAG: TetR/AcrR family transcriptional regulator [Spirochaetales bacterium]